jgi:xylan 1,4-beta-xylosidase
MQHERENSKTDTILAPILPGDYPDPSIVRVGEVYYMTHSSFSYTPGLLVWESRNLKEWEPIGHAIHRYVGGILAPELIYYEGLFYIYFPAGHSNWVVTAKSASGPWSDPIDLKVGFIDPGHLADQDGNRYLYLSDGYLIRLAPDGLSTTGDLMNVYEGWRYPSEWRTEGFYLEAPKLTFRDGFYYMTCAQGGTAGPATSHMVISARSTSPLGPWENSPYNPIVRTRNRDEHWRSKGHGTLVDTPDGNWYIVYHAYEKDYLTLGRQTLMESIEWTADGWFKLSDEPIVDIPVGIVSGMTLSDDFIGNKLAPQWHFYGGRIPDNYTVGQGELVLSGLSTKQVEPLLCIPYHHAYEVIVTLQVEANTVGRLGLFYKPGFQCGVGFDGNQVYVFRNNYNTEYTPITGKAVTLRLVNDRHDVDLFYQNVSLGWEKLDHSFDMSGFHNNVLGEFLSLRIALEAIGEGRVVIRDFRYNSLK